MPNDEKHTFRIGITLEEWRDGAFHIIKQYVDTHYVTAKEIYDEYNLMKNSMDS